MTRHLLTLDSIGRDGMLVNLELAAHLKSVKGMARDALAGGRVGMIFDKPSTRTRVSFEAAAWGLGMLPITLRPDELQLGRGETHRRHGPGPVALSLGARRSGPSSRPGSRSWRATRPSRSSTP